MTRDEILLFARDVGAAEPESLYGRTDYVVMTVSELERFVALVEEDVMNSSMPAIKLVMAEERKNGAAEEREACADICDQHASIEGIAQRCAAEIRKRGEV